jgi:hypothetical protein
VRLGVGKRHPSAFHKQDAKNQDRSRSALESQLAEQWLMQQSVNNMKPVAKVKPETARLRNPDQLRRAAS